jgi:hypothetical protein
MICKHCFYRHRTNPSFQGCHHATDDIIGVIWNEATQACETTYIRPFPYQLVHKTKKVVMCYPHGIRCRGEQGTYAHGQNELKQWNSKLQEYLGKLADKFVLVLN